MNTATLVINNESLSVVARYGAPFVLGAVLTAVVALAVCARIEKRSGHRHDQELAAEEMKRLRLEAQHRRWRAEAPARRGQATPRTTNDARLRPTDRGDLPFNVLVFPAQGARR